MHAIAKYVTLAAVLLVLPIRLGTDEVGKSGLTAPYASAKSGSGNDADKFHKNTEGDGAGSRQRGGHKTYPTTTKRLSNGAGATFSDGSPEEV